MTAKSIVAPELADYQAEGEAAPAVAEAMADTPEPKTVPPPHVPAAAPLDRSQSLVRALQLVVLLWVFLVGVRGLGEGFKGLGSGMLESLFAATSNPFLGLTIGIFATTLVQSSSVTTSMIVALVAAPHSPLPVANAIPMIMGANIGTTVTNTIVSLGHMSRPQEFRRAFSAATCHDFFNVLTVAILLPLEMATGALAHMSGAIATRVTGLSGGKLPNPVDAATELGLRPLEWGLAAISGGSASLANWLLIALSAAIIFAALYLIVRSLRVLAATRLKIYITRSIGSSGVVAMLVGAVVTVMVQSSSITTSVLVPLAAAGIVTLRQVFPITLGANIGTTVTALLASLAAPRETAELAVQIALVHLLFNVAGTSIIYPFEPIRRIPLRLAEWLADVGARSRKAALAYVVGLFYVLPALLIFLTRVL